MRKGKKFRGVLTLIIIIAVVALIALLGLFVYDKYDEYKKIIRGEVSIVVGTRSAVFAPLKNLGIIIIDEDISDNDRLLLESERDDEENSIMKEFYRFRGLNEDGSTNVLYKSHSFGEVKMWFLEQFKEIEQFNAENDQKLEEIKKARAARRAA